MKKDIHSIIKKVKKSKEIISIILTFLLVFFGYTLAYYSPAINMEPEFPYQQTNTLSHTQTHLIHLLASFKCASIHYVKCVVYPGNKIIS